MVAPTTQITVLIGPEIEFSGSHDLSSALPVTKDRNAVIPPPARHTHRDDVVPMRMLCRFAALFL